MAHIKKTLVRLFAVIAVALAMLLCGVLVGCGVTPSEEPEKPVDSVDTNNPDEIDDEPSDEPDDDDFEYVNPGMFNYELGRSQTGLGIRAEMAEKEEYDIDDISLDLIYGVDISLFNATGRNDAAFNRSDIEGIIYVSAFNLSDYAVQEDWGISQRKYDELGEQLHGMQNSEIQNGVLRIDEIPCSISNEYRLGNETLSHKPYISVDCLSGTEYEGIRSYDPYKLTCNKKVHITLPRELFTRDEGSIEFGIYVFFVVDDTVNYIYNSSTYERIDYEIHFDYKMTGDKVVLSNVVLGRAFVIDGTQNNVDTKTKSSSNAKPTEEAIVEYEKEI